MTFISRMAVEQADLECKIGHLEGFIEDTDRFNQLLESERSLLTAQRDYMKGYNTVLKARIEFYKEKTNE